MRMIHHQHIILLMILIIGSTSISAWHRIPHRPIILAFHHSHLSRTAISRGSRIHMSRSSTTSLPSIQEKDHRAALKAVVGAWGGWECRFGWKDGEVRRVPHSHLPTTYIEWEVDVWGWEGFVYDTLIEGEGGRVGVDRRSARFMVEAGCGCENVGKEKSKKVLGCGGGDDDSSNNSLFRLCPSFSPKGGGQAGGGHYITAEKLTDTLLRIEYCLVFAAAEEEGEKGTFPVRARVIVDYDSRLKAPREEITVFIEKRWASEPPKSLDSSDPFKDAIDASTISSRIGFPCFADPKFSKGDTEESAVAKRQESSSTTSKQGPSEVIRFVDEGGEHSQHHSLLASFSSLEPAPSGQTLGVSGVWVSWCNQGGAAVWRTFISPAGQIKESEVEIQR